MKIVELSKEEALHYCTKEEDHFFDKKAFGVSGEKIQKIAVAFANADGGEFVIGISDEKEDPNPKNRWCGTESTEAFNSAIQVLSSLIPSVDFRFDFLKMTGETRNYVLRVIVNKGLSVHQTSAGKIYVRLGAQSLPLTAPIKIMELTHAKGITSEEDSLVMAASLDDLVGSKHLSEFLKDLPIKEPDPLDFMLQEQLIDRDSWTPKVAAVLLFSDNPSAVLPKQCAIRVVRYDTDDEDIDRDALVENQSIEGPIYWQIEHAFEAIKEILSRNKIWMIDGHKEPNYPDETIWEILVNTAIHRDYSISDNVLISIFCNRIEFKSPGRLPGFVTTNNILDNRFSRNSKIVRILSKYKDSPNKDLGEGMNTAFQRMKSAGLREPEISEDGNYVKIVLRHASTLDPESLVIEFLKRHDFISNRQAREVTGIDSSDKVTYLFSKLREKGSIKRADSSTGTKAIWTLDKGQE